MRKVSALWIALVSFAGFLPAESVQCNYTATLVTVGGTPFGLSSADRGRVMTGYFSWDTATTNTSTDPNTGDYQLSLPGPGFSGVLSGGALTVTGSSIPTIQIVNTSTGGGDSFKFTDGPGLIDFKTRFMSVNGTAADKATLYFYIASGSQSVISSDALPTTFPWQGNDSINFPNTFDLSDGNGSLLFQLLTVSTQGPFGSVDTPANGATGLSGAIGVTGWALSNVGVTNVGLYREPVAGEAPPAGGLVFLSNAAQVPGARPDIAALYPSYPQNNVGWGAQILSNELPGANGGPIGVGTYKLHVLADALGVTNDLSGPITVAVDNATATAPFGTIDTPTQGGTASGTAFVNFGWALTPQPYNIPSNGSTINVFIDDKPVGHPVYNFPRGDIESLFPGYANTNGAVGYFKIDTTKLTNGLHTISWGVTDSAGHRTGIGSRFFNVQN